MKLISNIVWILLPFTLLLVQSCKEDKEDEHESDPLVTLTSPTINRMYPLGDTVWIKGSLSHDEDMHEYHVTLQNTSQDSVVYDSVVNIHGMKQADFSHYWVNSVSGHSDMKLTVNATDHHAKTGKSEVHFHCHPM